MISRKNMLNLICTEAIESSDDLESINLPPIKYDLTIINNHWEETNDFINPKFKESEGEDPSTLF